MMDESKTRHTQANYGSFSKSSRDDGSALVDPGQERLNQLGYKQVSWLWHILNSTILLRLHYRNYQEDSLPLRHLVNDMSLIYVCPHHHSYASIQASHFQTLGYYQTHQRHSKPVIHTSLPHFSNDIDTNTYQCYKEAVL